MASADVALCRIIRYQNTEQLIPEVLPRMTLALKPPKLEIPTHYEHVIVLFCPDSYTHTPRRSLGGHNGFIVAANNELIERFSRSIVTFLRHRVHNRSQAKRDGLTSELLRHLMTLPEGPSSAHPASRWRQDRIQAFNADHGCGAFGTLFFGCINRALVSHLLKLVPQGTRAFH